MVGIVDPPRAEAGEAIAQCRQAGVQVRMITGDHAITAAAIAAELGIPGRVVTGADLDAIDDTAELGRQLDHIGVVARVSPEHKLRLLEQGRHAPVQLLPADVLDVAGHPPVVPERIPGRSAGNVYDCHLTTDNGQHWDRRWPPGMSPGAVT